MPLTCNTTLDFASDVGYIYNPAEIEFVGGVAQLVAAFEGVSVLRTPALDASTWSLHSVLPDLVEALGYTHLFLVSFDAADNWNQYGPAGWKRRALADISTYGMPGVVLESVREWPSAGNLIFAVQLEREAGGGDGTISLITVCRGEEILAIDDEPDGADVLEPDPGGPGIGSQVWRGSMPDYSLSRTPMAHHEQMQFEHGYNLMLPTASLKRDGYDWVWAGRLPGEKDDLVAFIRAHQETAFVWTPPGGSALKWVFGEPEVTMVDPEVYNIKCDVTQSLPMEV